ncbi:hypothetical protein CJ430_31525, partial [Klebsiella pneumoniae]
MLPTLQAIQRDLRQSVAGRYYRAGRRGRRLSRQPLRQPGCCRPCRRSSATSGKASLADIIVLAGVVGV